MVGYFTHISAVFCLIVPAGEYRVRPGAGASRNSASEDANAPALTPYEMRTRKRIVQIMQVFSLARFPECFSLLTLLMLLLRYHPQRYFICHSAIDATITLHSASSCSNGTHLRRICHDAATTLAF